jgi:hypothetical protein
MDQMIYAATKVADYDKRIPSLSNKLTAAGINTTQMIQDIIDGKDEGFNEAKSIIEGDKKLNTDQKEDLLIALDDVGMMTLKRDMYLKEYDRIKKSPEDYQEQPEVDVEIDDTPKETITVKTKSGDRNIEVGTEYFLGKVTEYSEKGNEVYRAPRLTVLGENEDGTIKVKDSDGKVHDLKPSVLQKYNLGKVSSTLSNRKAKFYMEHWNTFFEFNFGKGIKRTGRLEYEQLNDGDDSLYFVYKNKKGEIKRIEVTGNQFVANKKKGFKEPMIREVGELTATQKKAKDDYTAQKDKRTEAKLERRAELLGGLYEEVLDKQESTEQLIAEKSKKLESIQADISAITEQIESNKNVEDNRFKAFKFKQVVANAIKQAKV